MQLPGEPYSVASISSAAEAIRSRNPFQSVALCAQICAMLLYPLSRHFSLASLGCCCCDIQACTQANSPTVASIIYRRQNKGT